MTDPQARAGRGMEQEELVFVALGGLGEIGMNVYLYGLGPPDSRRWLMVDLGITFPGEAEPGVDVVLPDLRFIEEERTALAGIVLTHAHEDHLGAVIDLWPRLKAPIWATPFTAAMLDSKLAENGRRLKLPVNVVDLGARFRVGPFDLEFVTLAHSIPEPSGLVIRTPLGVVFHSGDWKLDRTPLVGDPSDDARLRALGEEGITALVCDSTNAFREGRSPSEVEVAASIAAIIKGAERRVAVTTFASNVARIRAVADAARAAGRHLVVVGRALHRVIEVAKATGYLPADFRYLDQEQFSYLEPQEVVALCTGSQGEPRAALARIAEDDHPDVSLADGDLAIFSSRPIPGNEKAIARVQNNLARLGCRIITDADALVHVTGHPRREELRQIYAWLRPKVAVPMHGEVRHLRAHGDLARAAGVPEVRTPADGEMLRLAPDPVAVIDEVPVGRQYRDGALIVPADPGPVRERRKLAFVGVIAVGFALDVGGNLLGEPEAALDGVPAETMDGRSMYDLVLDAVDGTLKSIPPGRRRDIERVREAVRRAVRAAVDQAWGKRPIVKVLITTVPNRF
ncbi:MAG TPA: ribonuclease J [Hyphomicrobiaceae bacterium]|nr:ribonuclease J [Hyphomicrobiaceae bacterium]